MKNKALLINFIGVCLNFYLLPFLFRGNANETILILVVMPAITIVLGVSYTMMNQPHWFYPVIVGVLFIPTMFIFYNLSAIIFAMIHFLGFVVGCLVGIIIKNLISNKNLSRT
ncbi:hypothetical protein [Anaerorhabdus sp.]|uniref:hypothetical protein n=1 Tax=Anaerorhabdus sp. TaxID=1872524 RepID=UPI002FC5D0B3